MRLLLKTEIQCSFPYFAFSDFVLGVSFSFLFIRCGNRTDRGVICSTAQHSTSHTSQGMAFRPLLLLSSV